MPCELRQDPSRRSPIAFTNAFERLRNGCLDCTLADRIRPHAAFRELEYRTSPIVRIVGASQQAMADESLEHPGERAGMHAQHRRQIAGRQTGTQADDAKDQSLRAGDADLARHPLRGTLESMNHRPQQLHELQHVGQIRPFRTLRLRIHRNYFEFKVLDDTTAHR
jgi:hypothetical protein